MQGDPYGTQNGVYGLAHLIHSYLTGMRYEPNLVGPETAQTAGTGAVDAAMDQVMTEQWQDRMRAAREGQKAVGDAMSKVKRSPKADKQATQDWINKMRAAREGQKAVGTELAPENTNRPPGSEASQVSTSDYSLLPETFPGVRGVGVGPMTGGRPPPMPPPANMFPPQGPTDPNVPKGPKVRAPGKPDPEEAPVE